MPAWASVAVPPLATALLIARLPAVAVSVTAPATLTGRSTVRSVAAVAVTVPLPVMPPACGSRVLSDTLPERLKASVALLVTAPLPSVPLAPPLPTASVPALALVVPV